MPEGKKTKAELKAEIKAELELEMEERIAEAVAAAIALTATKGALFVPEGWNISKEVILNLQAAHKAAVYKGDLVLAKAIAVKWKKAAVEYRGYQRSLKLANPKRSLKYNPNVHRGEIFEKNKHLFLRK